MDSAEIAEMTAARLLGIPMDEEELIPYLAARITKEIPLRGHVFGWRAFKKCYPIEQAMKHSLPWAEFHGLVWFRLDGLDKLRTTYPIWFERLRKYEVPLQPHLQL